MNEHDAAVAAPSRRWRRVRIYICLALLVLAPFGGMAALALIEDAYEVNNWAVVEKGLIYRSGQIDADQIESMLTSHGIQVVIDLQGEKGDDPDQNREIEVVKELGLESHRFWMAGNGTGKVERYVGAVATVAKSANEKRPVLVHCAAGAHRTGGVIASYRMLVQGWSPERAIKEMDEHGWNPERNTVLYDFLRVNIAEIAAGLVSQGVIVAEPEAVKNWRR